MAPPVAARLFTLVLAPAVVVVVFSRRRGHSNQNKTDVHFSRCKYRATNTTLGNPEVFWINLKASVDRRSRMTTFLHDWGVRHRRVDALGAHDFYIPPDLLTADQTSFRCVAETAFDAHAKVDAILPKLYPRKLFVSGLCGHATNNQWFRHELAVVVSHLLAIREAVYSDTATGPYALILEDDVWTPFNVDLHLLAREFERETKRHFGIFQLFNSKPHSLRYTYFCMRRPNNYGCHVELGSRSNRWAVRYPVVDGRSLFSLSTAAYLVNRYVMKDVIGAYPFGMLR